MTESVAVFIVDVTIPFTDSRSIINYRSGFLPVWRSAPLDRGTESEALGGRFHAHMVFKRTTSDSTGR